MLREAAVAAFLLATADGVAPKLEATGPLTGAAVPEAVRGALEPKGVRVVLREGPLCELWLRKSIPERKRSTPGALQIDLRDATAIGVIRFLAATTDFRGQGIRSGLYTLRYARIPADGNHLGVSEYPDFLLLTPFAEDSDLANTLELEDLMKRSLMATDTAHPGVLSLTRPSGDTFSAVTTNALGHVVLQMKAKIGSREAPIALVVKGEAPQ